MTKPNEKSTSPAKRVSLIDVCREMKLDPREARLRLRAASKDKAKFAELASAHRPRRPWEWEAGSAALEQARAALTEAR